MKLLKLSEHEIQSQILGYLEHLHGAFFWRNNTGAFAGEYRGKRRFVRFGVKGAPDILVVLKGHLIGIEVKARGGELSKNQEEFRDRLLEAGATYIVAYSLEDVTCWLEPPVIRSAHSKNAD